MGPSLKLKKRKGDSALYFKTTRRPEPDHWIERISWLVKKKGILLGKKCEPALKVNLYFAYLSLQKVYLKAKYSFSFR